MLEISAELCDCTVDELLTQHNFETASQLKQFATDVVVEHVTPIGKRVLELEADAEHLEAILADGAERARAIADPQLRRIKDAIGM